MPVVKSKASASVAVKARAVTPRRWRSFGIEKPKPSMSGRQGVDAEGEEPDDVRDADQAARAHAGADHRQDRAVADHEGRRRPAAHDQDDRASGAEVERR